MSIIQTLIARNSSVDGVLKDFTNIIKRLEVAEQREAKKLEDKISQIAQLEAEKIGHALESDRAKAIRTKIEQLIA